MKKNILIIISLVIIALTSCQKSDSELSVTQQLVVKGYLYQNQSVDSIYVSKTISFTSEDTIYPPVNDATVSIIWNNKSYTLANIGNGYYSYKGNGLSINAGEKYSIDIKAGTIEATSSTIVPDKTAGLTISATTVTIDTTLSPMQREGTTLTVTWTNNDKSYYFVTVENTDPLPKTIEYSGFSFFSDSSHNIRPNFRFRSEPFITNQYEIRTMLSIRQYGKHRVRVFKVNQEYADMYENRNQDSRNLTEPATNIVGGLGVFTAFSYADTTFVVKKK